MSIPLHSRLLFPLWCLVVVACTGRTRHSATCAWLAESQRPLALGRSSDRTHLRTDVDLAEDIAISYADSARGLRSRNYQGRPEYDRAREQCLDSLSLAIADVHSLSVGDVRAYRGRRSTAFDVIVILSFAALYYGLVGTWAAGWLTRTFPADERLTAALATVIAAATVGFMGVLLGDFWSFTAEGLRIYNGHLSYRAARIPWSQHRLAAFVIGVILFGVIALMRYRRRTPAGE